ncbi:MAG: phosphonate C-P lyase system protein PhnH [Ilumatobacteraceae bacterium]
MDGLMGVDATTIARARLHPDESRRVFRVLVDALANPGRTYRLPHDVVGRAPMALVPMLAMCDIEVSIAVHPDRHDWAGAVTVATGAPSGELEDAEWVAFLTPPTPQVLALLDPGSTYEPERGTRIAVAVHALVTVDDRHAAPAGATVIRLSGPGVAGHADLAVGGVPASVFDSLAAINADFPAGLDTWLLSADGRVAAIPRSSSIEVR